MSYRLRVLIQRIKYPVQLNCSGHRADGADVMRCDAFAFHHMCPGRNPCFRYSCAQSLTKGAFPIRIPRLRVRPCNGQEFSTHLGGTIPMLDVSPNHASGASGNVTLVIHPASFILLRGRWPAPQPRGLVVC
jgi:hypothetical protein